MFLAPGPSPFLVDHPVPPFIPDLLEYERIREQQQQEFDRLLGSHGQERSAQFEPRSHLTPSALPQLTPVVPYLPPPSTSLRISLQRMAQESVKQAHFEGWTHAACVLESERMASLRLRDEAVVQKEKQKWAEKKRGLLFLLGELDKALLVRSKCGIRSGHQHEVQTSSGSAASDQCCALSKVTAPNSTPTRMRAGTPVKASKEKKVVAIMEVPPAAVKQEEVTLAAVKQEEVTLAAVKQEEDTLRDVVVANEVNASPWRKKTKKVKPVPEKNTEITPLTKVKPSELPAVSVSDVMAAVNGKKHSQLPIPSVQSAHAAQQVSVRSLILANRNMG